MELFRIEAQQLHSLERSKFKLERDVQRLFEENLQAVLGVRFLASEYSTGDKHAGRIDSLGIDENGTPVIIEYKLSSNDAIISQALFYLDWLLDHHGDFELLVQKRLGPTVSVDWSSPRVVCVAESFSKYDSYAVTSIGANIELVAYRLFAGQYLGIDVAGAALGQSKVTKPPKLKHKIATIHTIDEHLAYAKGDLRDIATELVDYISGLGEDVSVNPVQDYIAFRTTRNFCCLETHNKHLFLHLSLDPVVGKDCDLCRDMRKIGHFGTGDLEVRVEKVGQVEKAKEFALMAYENTVVG